MVWFLSLYAYKTILMTNASYRSGVMYWVIHLLFVLSVAAFWFITPVAVGYATMALAIVLLVVRIFKGDD